MIDFGIENVCSIKYCMCFSKFYGFGMVGLISFFILNFKIYCLFDFMLNMKHFGESMTTLQLLNVIIKKQYICTYILSKQGFPVYV